VTTDFVVRINVRSALDFESLTVEMQLSSCPRLHPVLTTCNLVYLYLVCCCCSSETIVSYGQHLLLQTVFFREFFISFFFDTFV